MTKKSIFNYLVILLLVFTTIFNHINILHSEAFIQDLFENNVEENPFSWRQYHPDYSKSTPKGAGQQYMLDGEHTVGEWGCSYYSLSFARIRHQSQNPATETVVDVHRKIHDAGGDTGPGNSDFGPCYWSSVPSIYPDEIATCQRDPGGYDINGTNIADGVKKAMDDGYYVIGLLVSPKGEYPTNGHYIFFDYYEDGDVYIVDSYSDYKTWNTGYPQHGGYICGYVLITFKDGKKPNDLPTLWETYGDGGPVTNENEEQEQEQDTSENDYQTPEEWNLKGMPEKSEIMKNQREVVPLTYAEDLTASELVNVGNLKETIRATEADNKMRTGRMFILLIGLSCCLYAVFLFLAYVFDVSNPFFDISMLTIFSFGQLHVEYRKQDSKNILMQGEGSRHALLGIGALFILGMLICTGALGVYIAQKVDMFRTLLDGVWGWLST